MIQIKSQNHLKRVKALTILNKILQTVSKINCLASQFQKVRRKESTSKSQKLFSQKSKLSYLSKINMTMNHLTSRQSLRNLRRHNKKPSTKSEK